MQTVQDWGQAIMTSLAGALALFFAAIPRLIGFLLILLIGWFIAGLIARAVTALLRSLKFNDLAERSGFGAFVRNAGVNADPSTVIAEVAKWAVRLIVLVVAFDALGLPAVSEVLRQLLLWLPNLVVALVVLVIGGLAAGGLGRLVQAATTSAGFSNPRLLGSIASVAVWGFAIVVAVNQLGIATTLVNTLFMAVVGAIALAAGLAFGLGGRETAAQIVQGWYQQGRANAPKVREAAERAQQQVQESRRQGT